MFKCLLAWLLLALIAFHAPLALAVPPTGGTPAPGTQVQSQSLEQQLRVAKMEVAFWRTQSKLWMEGVTGIGNNALQAPFGRFLLVRWGSRVLAIRIMEHVPLPPPLDRVLQGNLQYDKYDWRLHRMASKYDWYLSTDGPMSFQGAGVQRGQGELVEQTDGNDIGYGFLHAGPFVLPWSQGDWVYFPRSASASAETSMTITEKVRIEDVNPADKSVVWLTAKQLTAYTHELSGLHLGLPGGPVR